MPGDAFKRFPPSALPENGVSITKQSQEVAVLMQAIYELLALNIKLFNGKLLPTRQIFNTVTLEDAESIQRQYGKKLGGYTVDRNRVQYGEAEALGTLKSKKDIRGNKLSREELELVQKLADLMHKLGAAVARQQGAVNSLEKGLHIVAILFSYNTRTQLWHCDLNPAKVYSREQCVCLLPLTTTGRSIHVVPRSHGGPTGAISHSMPCSTSALNLLVGYGEMLSLTATTIHAGGASTEFTQEEEEELNFLELCQVGLHVYLGAARAQAGGA